MLPWTGEIVFTPLVKYDSRKKHLHIFLKEQKGTKYFSALGMHEEAF